MDRSWIQPNFVDCGIGSQLREGARHIFLAALDQLGRAPEIPKSCWLLTCQANMPDGYAARLSQFQLELDLAAFDRLVDARHELPDLAGG